jgi:hypothetical protein
MVIFEDMLNPRHNGKRYDVYKVIDEFPKDIIIAPWGGTAPDITAAYFADKGFEVWGSATSYWTYGKLGKSKVKGYGISAYKYGSGYKLFRTSPAFSAYEQFMGADYAWNMNRPTDTLLMDEIASGKLIAQRELFALQPNPNASETVMPIDIQKSMNTSLNEMIKQDTPGVEITRMPMGSCNPGNIKTMLSKDTGKNCILLGKGSAIEFPADTTFSSLIFLHTGYISPKALKAFRGHWRYWIYGYPFGDYSVTYADGTSEKLPVRLKWEKVILTLPLLT